MEKMLEKESRKNVEDEAKNYLNEQVRDWGYVTEAVAMYKLNPPSEISDIRREFKTSQMKQAVADQKTELSRKEGEARAKKYKAETRAELKMYNEYLDVKGKEYGIVVNTISQVREQFQDEKTSRDVLYLLFGQYLGEEHPVTKKIKKQLGEEGVAEASRKAAEEINSSPKFAYLVNNLKNTNPLLVGNVNDLANLDRRLQEELYDK